MGVSWKHCWIVFFEDSADVEVADIDTGFNTVVYDREISPVSNTSLETKDSVTEIWCWQNKQHN